MAGKTYSIKAVIQAVDRMTAPLRRISLGIRTRLGGALRGIGRIAGGVTRSLGAMLGPLGLIAGGGVVASLGAMVQGFAKSGDEIGKFARQIGWGVEALQEMRFAADRAGVPVEQFDKAVARMNQRIGEACMGMGGAATYLKMLPKSFQDALVGAKSSEEAFDLLMGSMAAIKDPVDRAGFAFQFFGRAGLKLQILSEGGAEAIAKLRQEARDLGLVIGKDGTGAAEEFVDRMTDLKAALSGLKMTIGSALLPVLRPMIVSLTGWVAKNRELIGQKIGDFVRGVVEWLRKVDFAAIGRGVSDVAGAIKDVFEAVGGVKGVLAGLALIKFGPLLLSLNPVAIALGGILALAIAVKGALDGIATRGKVSGAVGQAHGRAFALTGDPEALRRDARARAREAADAGQGALLSDPLRDRSAGSAVLGGLLTFTGLARRRHVDATSAVSGSQGAVRDVVSALADELQQGPPTLGTLRAMDLKITLDDRRAPTIEVTDWDGPARPNVRLGTPRGRSGPALRGR